MKAVPCHRCQQFPAVFVHDGAAYLTGNRECITCKKFVERYDEPERAIARWNHTVTRKPFAGASISARAVPTETFDRIMSNRILLRGGPCRCDCGGTVKIHMPVYGMVGLYIECPYCKESTGVYSVTEPILDKGSTLMSTPYTFNAIMESLRMAVEEWNQNGASRKGESK